MIKFITKNWFSILILAILAFLIYDSQRDLNKYREQVEDYKVKIIDLQDQIDIDIKTIDSLSKVDPIIVKEIDTIKLKADENIKFVDTMSVSDMQSFYSERYKN
jgi:hypothetical protein